MQEALCCQWVLKQVDLVEWIGSNTLTLTKVPTQPWPISPRRMCTQSWNVMVLNQVTRPTMLTRMWECSQIGINHTDLTTKAKDGLQWSLEVSSYVVTLTSTISLNWRVANQERSILFFRRTWNHSKRTSSIFGPGIKLRKETQTLSNTPYTKRELQLIIENLLYHHQKSLLYTRGI